MEGAIKKSFKTKSKFNWDDVQIQAQYDGTPPILNLKYTPDYQELMDYFRAILKSGEISERAYEISGFVVAKLCSNYNAWYLRQLCLEKLDTLTFEQELDFVNELKEGNEKVFQLWDHRRYLIEKLNDPKDEIVFLEEVMEQDNKNYHAWSYRIWLCEKFNLFESEWDIIQKYFEQDRRNNSIWNYRYFIFSSKLYNGNKDKVQEEIDFTFKILDQDLNNEAAWNYLQGFFEIYEFLSLKPETHESHKKPAVQYKFKDFSSVKEKLSLLLQKNQRNKWILTFLIEINIEENTQESIKQALVYVQYLAGDVDKNRLNYWKWYDENLKKDFSTLLQQE